MRVVLVGAARPNFVKVAPILRALEALSVDVVLVHTDQHYDDAMSGRFFRELGIREPDVRLSAGSGTHAKVTSAVMLGFEPVLKAVAPDAVVVVGDVNSTLACALVAAKSSVPVAHVEAGLRSRDRDMPEEVNRILTDNLSDWLFTTSPDADVNLALEGFHHDRIFLVGNVMIDTLLFNRTRVDAATTLSSFDVSRMAYVLVTLHRPSNVDDVATLSRLIDVLSRISEHQTVLFPVHPRTRSRLASLDVEIPGAVRLVEPAGYLDFLALMDNASIVLTDSGGVQEETTVLGVPCLTLRESTERPVTVTEGTNRVVGTDADTILAAYLDGDTLRTGRRPTLWDGHAAQRIADILVKTPPPLSSQRGAPTSAEKKKNVWESGGR